MQTAVLAHVPIAGPQAGACAPLDEPVEWQGFSRPVGGQAGRWESWLAITGMHCAACSLTVEATLAGLPGVAAVEVNGPAALARVLWSPGQTRPSAWLAALARAGYGALPAGDMLAAQPRRQAARQMLWRWLVAGFCMMQVMMYAFPAYVAGPGEITPDIAALLLWASWILTLPVLLFCCQPFFASALRDLRRRRIGMDVPVALGVLIAFGASTAATFDARAGGQVWYDSVTMFVFFLLSGRLLELRLRDRTAGALEALMRRLPGSVERRNAGGRFERVPVRRLQAGDLIRVLPGEVIPADGVVEAGASRVDEALLTGESSPLLRERSVLVNGVSKTYAMTGWRIGYAAGPADIIAALDMLQSQSTSNASSVSQAAALAALTSEATFLPQWVATYKQRRDRALELINAIPGLHCPTPGGAFYLYVNCGGLIGKRTPGGAVLETDLDVVLYFLDAAGVAVVAGSSYGSSPYFRISIATAVEVIEQGCTRIRRAVMELA